MNSNSQPRLAPVAPAAPPEIEPRIQPLDAPELEEELALRNGQGDPADIDPESVVEAAELLLRVGAPHDFDVVVIGAGPGGLACATHLATSGQNVALIERDEVGGVCLNKGCIPTKTLLESVGALRLVRRAASFGVRLDGEISGDLPQMQRRKREVVADLRAQSERLAEEAGVSLLRGTARLKGEGKLELESPDGAKRDLSAVHIVLATGGAPSKLPIEGADLPGVLTSDDILELEQVPRRLLVLGASAVGVEFASIFVELGARVSIVEKAGAVLPGEDEDVQREMQHSLEASDIELILNASVERIEGSSSGLMVAVKTESGERMMEAEFVLMAAGRKANIEDLGLEEAGVDVENGAVKADEDGSTSATGVWAIGDCIRRVGWAHQAALEGRRVADAILGIDSDIDARFVPACYYTFPEVASVGLTLSQAQEKGIEARVGQCAFRSNGRANTSGDNGGFVKLVVESATGKLLGAQIIGPRATELINEISVALRDGDTAERLADSLHAHPTFAEVLPGAARAALRGG
jgi:dihydrolipoamide dehydrogenase